MTTWRTSSYSNNGSCVAVADLGTAVLVCNSNAPSRGTLTLPRSAVAEFVAGCAQAEFDDLG